MIVSQSLLLLTFIIQRLEVFYGNAIANHRFIFKVFNNLKIVYMYYFFNQLTISIFTKTN